MMHKPFKIGKAAFPNSVFYSPLAGCSDYPFRQMSAKYGPGLMYCEMVKMEPLIRNIPLTYKMLEYEESMRPIGAQICGSKTDLAAPSAKIIEDLGFDVVDFNCGCPVDKVTKDGSGSAMLKTPERIGEVIANMVAAVDIPVTVKIRAGWDDDHINAREITKIAEEAGASAIAIHGRTRKQAYRGPANWDHIKACKEAAVNIKVIGNGDVFDPPSAKRMAEYTGCDAVLVSRGTMGQPWIASDILKEFTGEPWREKSAEECRDELYEHFERIIDYHEERKALVDIRRVGCWYLKKAFGTRDFRGKICRSATLEEAKELILNYEACDSVEV